MSKTLFKRFVTFDVDKVVLKDSCSKELAIAFYMMETPNIRVVCECGHKLDKHSIIE